MLSTRRVRVWASLLCWSGVTVAHADVAPTLSVELAPSASYRTFRDREPTSADKHYATTATLGGELRVRVYPWARARSRLSGVGAYAHGAGSLLTSQDIDIAASEEGHDVSTTFWRAGVGLLYRVPTHVGPARLDFVLVGGVDRWAFTFAMPEPAAQLTPTARYSLARIGAEADLGLGVLAVRAHVHGLLPWSIDDLGDRPAISKGWGVQVELSPSYQFAPHWALFASGRVTVFQFDLPQVLPRSDENASAHDRYVDVLLGGRLTW